MKREDLKNGSILETRSGEHCVVIGNDLYFIERGVQSYLFRFDDNLKEMHGFEDDDIMKVCIDPMKSNEWDWERKETPKLTDDEKAFLKMLDSKWKWITACSLGAGFWLTENKPTKDEDGFFECKGDSTTLYQTILDANMFLSLNIKEPYNIEELLEGSED